MAIEIGEMRAQYQLQDMYKEELEKGIEKGLHDIILELIQAKYHIDASTWL